MAFAIPRIQYSNVDTTCTTTLSNGTLTVIPDVSQLQIGMFVRGTGIPAGATIGSIGVNAITLAGGVLATANGTLVAVSFGFEILFTYPPVEPTGESFENKGTVSISLSGVQQTSTNYIEASRKLNFSFLSPTLFATFDAWVKTFAIYGNTFRYYDDQTLTTYNTYQIKTLKTNPVKRSPCGQDIYRWDYTLDFRRAL